MANNLNYTRKMSLAGKVALITGGTKGIGFAVAQKLHQKGATVIINYNSDDVAATKAVKELGGDESALAIKADVSKIADIQSLVKTVANKYSKIDILINNAGIMIHETPLNITEDSYDKIFDINVKGPLFLLKEVGPYIPEGGRVVFLSTSLTAASAIAPNYSLYVATKGAIEQFVRTAAKEFGKKGVTVNTLSPGPTETELFHNVNTPQTIAMIKGLTPFGRLGQPSEVADALIFLTSPESGWVNGQNIRANGGFVV